MYCCAKTVWRDYLSTGGYPRGICPGFFPWGLLSKQGYQLANGVVQEVYARGVLIQIGLI